MAKNINSELFLPGSFEFFYGPMKSGKTEALLKRLDKVDYHSELGYKVFRPLMDNREERSILSSRYSKKEVPATLVSHEEPFEIISYLEKDTKIVVIDEVQFFSKELAVLIHNLKHENFNVIGAGLYADFRGQPYKFMSQIFSEVTHPTFLKGVCEYINDSHMKCNNASTYTQRLLDGKPASWNDSIDLVETEDGKDSEGRKVTYETRCVHHHEVKDVPLEFSYHSFH